MPRKTAPTGVFVPGERTLSLADRVVETPGPIVDVQVVGDRVVVCCDVDGRWQYVGYGANRQTDYSFQAVVDRGTILRITADDPAALILPSGKLVSLHGGAFAVVEVAGSFAVVSRGALTDRNVELVSADGSRLWTIGSNPFVDGMPYTGISYESGQLLGWIGDGAQFAIDPETGWVVGARDQPGRVVGKGWRHLIGLYATTLILVAIVVVLLGFVWFCFALAVAGGDEPTFYSTFASDGVQREMQDYIAGVNRRAKHPLYLEATYVNPDAEHPLAEGLLVVTVPNVPGVATTPPADRCAADVALAIRWEQVAATAEIRNARLVLAASGDGEPVAVCERTPR